MVRPVLVAAAVWAASLGAQGCHGAHRGRAPEGGDASPPASSAQSAREAIDAAPPPDDAIPRASSDELTVRSRHLLEAIAKDDASLAADILFPRDGWIATRDVADPGREWEKRTAAPFRRAIHALSRRHHKEVARAQLVSIELGHAMVQATPRRGGWKVPLWTLTGSRLTFVVDGRTRELPVHELTAWRGAWYVTRM